EALVAVRVQLPALDEASKGLVDKFVAWLDDVEDASAEDEEAAVDPDVGATERVDRVHDAAVIGCDDVVLSPRLYRDEQPGGPAPFQRCDHVVERSVGEPVAVRRKEDLVVADVPLHPLQPLADGGVHAGVDEGDRPAIDVLSEELDITTSVREDEIVPE